jgi:hypothetical protein
VLSNDKRNRDSYCFSVESVASIQNVLNLVTAPGHAKLFGYKRLAFIHGSDKLKTMPCYRTIIVLPYYKEKLII